MLCSRPMAQVSQQQAHFGRVLFLYPSLITVRRGCRGLLPPSLLLEAGHAFSWTLEVLAAGNSKSLSAKRGCCYSTSIRTARTPTTPNAGEAVKQQELSFIAGGNAKWWLWKFGGFFTKGTAISRSCLSPWAAHL